LRPVPSFLLGLWLALVGAPLAAWWALSVHESRCEWGEPFWTGDLPTAPGPVEGLLLGSSRMGADVDVVALGQGTSLSWQRLARHTLSDTALPPSYPLLLGASDAHPGLSVLVIEVNALLMDQVSCGRPPIPHIPLRPAWLAEAEGLGVENRPSALSMALLPHRWLAGSGRRHDLIEHLKHPAHAIRVLGDLRHGGREVLARWPGEPAPERTPENALKRRAFLLGQPLENWVPAVNDACIEAVATTVRAAAAQRTFLVILPMRPMLRSTVEPEYETSARLAFRELASALPRTALLDFSTRFDEDESQFNDFDHLTPAGAAAFTAELVELFE
jgi:hypothetical protein